MEHHWTGVFPAITTQTRKSGALDLDATARHTETLLAGDDLRQVLKIIREDISCRPRLPKAWELGRTR